MKFQSSYELDQLGPLGPCHFRKFRISQKISRWLWVSVQEREINKNKDGPALSDAWSLCWSGVILLFYSVSSLRHSHHYYRDGLNSDYVNVKNVKNTNCYFLLCLKPLSSHLYNFTPRLNTESNIIMYNNVKGSLYSSSTLSTISTIITLILIIIIISGRLAW